MTAKLMSEKNKLKFNYLSTVEKATGAEKRRDEGRRDEGDNGKVPRRVQEGLEAKSRGVAGIAAGRCSFRKQRRRNSWQSRKKRDGKFVLLLRLN